jgi:hypothetical protein
MPDEFSRNFEMMMGKFCECKVKPSSYRQMAVGIAREHILPQHFLGADSTIDEAAHHGGTVAHSHYGIVEGDLPYLTTDSVWQHRAIDKEWHNITGVGMHQPPRPIRLLTEGRRTPQAQAPSRPAPTWSASTGSHGTGSPADPSSGPLAGLGGVTTQSLEEALGRVSELLLAKVQRTLVDEILPAVTRAVIEKIGVHKCQGATVAAGGGDESDESESSWEIAPASGPVQAVQPSSSLAGSSQSSLQDRSHSDFRWTPDPVPTSQKTAITSPALAPARDLGNLSFSLPPSSFPATSTSSWTSSLAPIDIDDPLASVTEIMLTGSESSQGQHTTGSESPSASIVEIVGDSGQVPAHWRAGSEDSGLGIPSTSDGSTPSNLESLATEARRGLRLLFQDPAVVEKSEAQLEFLVACMECREDIQAILPTGGGKSAGWLVPAMLDPGRASAVVTPYTLLLEDQLRSARERGIVAEQFTASELHRLGPREDVQLVFVQPETVASRAFRE